MSNLRTAILRVLSAPDSPVISRDQALRLAERIQEAIVPFVVVGQEIVQAQQLQAQQRSEGVVTPLLPPGVDRLCDCDCTDDEIANNLSTWHPDPPGWTCRECLGFVPKARMIP